MSSTRIAQLESRLAHVHRHEASDVAERFTLGIDRVDAYMDPGPCLFRLHDIYAQTAADAAAANAFAFGLASRATQDRPIVWIFQNLASQEAGALHGPGLHEWGLRPESVLLVRVGHATDLLSAGEEALKSGAAGAVLMSGWGESKAMTLTASRRLAMAARVGASTAFMVRAAATVMPSAADTRWLLRSALSSEMEAGAPGQPAFVATLTRSRQGAAPAEWTLEWDRETRAFCEPAPLSSRLVSIPVVRSATTRRSTTGMQRAG